jgi:bacteriochlorophyll 4-vinyl reductase
MRSEGVGRVLVAGLHQAIGDVLPTRLGFYENWLNVGGLRDGTIGMAPLQAVLSFLREEGEPYDPIVVRAGEYAAEWTVASMGPVERSLIGRLPRSIRARYLLGVARRLVRSAYGESRTRSRVRKGTARVEIHPSVFCGVRHPGERPLCRYYAAVCTRLLAEFGMDSEAVVAQCRGMGAERCVIEVALAARRPSPSPADAEAA